MRRIKLEIVVHKAAAVLLAILLTASLRGAESVCLKSGFCIQADSHLISDDVLVVRAGSGTVQFPADQVDQIRLLTDAAARQTSPTTQVPVRTNNAGIESEELLMRAAIREGLEPDFVRSVALVESNLHQSAVSPKGAVGLMQLMPMTAGQLGVDPKQADQNALGGATFLRQLLIRYRGDSALALAAYNAGPGAVAKYNGVPPYFETRRYIVKVLQEYERQRRMTKQPVGAVSQ